MVKNENWWGLKTAAPTTRFPKPSNPQDVEKGYWTEDREGSTVAMCDRIEWYKELEPVTKFGKFLQGYYDSIEIPAEKIGEAVTVDIVHRLNGDPSKRSTVHVWTREFVDLQDCFLFRCILWPSVLGKFWPCALTLGRTCRNTITPPTYTLYDTKKVSHDLHNPKIKLNIKIK